MFYLALISLLVRMRILEVVGCVIKEEVATSFHKARLSIRLVLEEWNTPAGLGNS